MLRYIYDSSFEGLLTAVYDVYYEKTEPEQIISENLALDSLLFEKRYVETDAQKAGKVYEAIINKISVSALENIMHAFLSEHQYAGIYILEYLRFGFKVGGIVDSYLSDDRVHNIHSLVRKVGREKQLLLGILRFKLLENGIYYAPIEPHYNTICLLGEHFASRMADQRFVIHDLARNYGVFYDGEKWFMSPVDINRDVILHQNELYYQELWQKYFEGITIMDRLNPKRQAGFMPKRYWKHLIEKF